MKFGEGVSDYFSRVMSVANKMRVHGEQMRDVTIVEKILRSLSDKFNYIVCSIEESKDIDRLSIDELQSSLVVHEQKFHRHNGEEQALKVTFEDRVVAVDPFEEEAEAENVNPSIKLLWSATSVINLDTSSMNVRVGTKRQILPSLEKKKRCC
ncbi:hypothetical protein LWI28_003355 [Acer negundo]|uniref:Retrovirus-related Pol polyprotein from transposon TNT 1-94 n=1 Tax=Acer negundo TaxID=4023 RepID=A0AAD5JC63_ACENE|nr:hypothetical protein LWI28_003355 [Acer negundo]